MSDKDGKKVPTAAGPSREVDDFLRKVAAIPASTPTGRRGRLVFALDATASRQPTWDSAAQIQAAMFKETANLGGLEVQLAFFRGFGEFKVAPWLSQTGEILRLMTSVFCLAGQTQIRKVLRHAVNETKKRRINALVYVGDCLEEDIDMLGEIAGELGVLGVPCFMFHEGDDPIAEFGFRQIAKLTNGACCRFDAASPDVLRDLLGAVAVFAAGGRPALEDLARRKGGEVLRIAHQMKGGGRS